MKELLQPIVYIALTIFAVGGAAIMPVLVYSAYKELLRKDR